MSEGTASVCSKERSEVSAGSRFCNITGHRLHHAVVAAPRCSMNLGVRLYDCSMDRPCTEVTAYGMHDAMHHEAGGDAELMQLQSAHSNSSFGIHEVGNSACFTAYRKRHACMLATCWHVMK